MKILITGGNGFLGSNLAKLFYKNHDVLVISKNNNNLIDILDDIQFNKPNYDLFIDDKNLNTINWK